MIIEKEMNSPCKTPQGVIFFRTPNQTNILTLSPNKS